MTLNTKNDVPSSTIVTFLKIENQSINKTLRIFLEYLHATMDIHINVKLLCLHTEFNIKVSRYYDPPHTRSPSQILAGLFRVV